MCYLAQLEVHFAVVALCITASCLDPEAVAPDSDGTDVIIEVPLHAAHAAADVDIVTVVLAACILIPKLHHAATLPLHAEGGGLVPTTTTVAGHADDLPARAHIPAEGSAAPVVVLVGVDSAHILVVPLTTLVVGLLSTALAILVRLLAGTGLGGSTGAGRTDLVSLLLLPALSLLATLAVLGGTLRLLLALAVLVDTLDVLLVALLGGALLGGTLMSLAGPLGTHLGSALATDRLRLALAGCGLGSEFTLLAGFGSLLLLLTLTCDPLGLALACDGLAALLLRLALACGRLRPVLADAGLVAALTAHGLRLALLAHLSSTFTGNLLGLLFTAAVGLGLLLLLAGLLSLLHGLVTLLSSLVAALLAL